jgi:hypothetical protein
MKSQVIFSMKVIKNEEDFVVVGIRAGKSLDFS